MKKLKLIFIGWLLSNVMVFTGYKIILTTHEWCMRYNNSTPDEVNDCAAKFYNSWLFTGKVLRYNPVMELFYFAASIIDGE